MTMTRTKFLSIDEYISVFPHDIRQILKQIRATVKKAAPAAEEKISYGMPAYALEGNLVYFAAFKNHIGFYPTSSAVKAFSNELSAYAGAKGSVRFPLDKPIPLNLIAKIVKFRVKENLERAKTKKYS
jgi:uncharacterized protein YdhG (YjbR/CyaY superfamily)